jgi:transcriptional regulator with XRE-family HTH domain
MEKVTEVPRLREVREALRRTLEDVAKEAGIDPGYLSRIERGLQRPSTATLVAICRVLGLRKTVAAIEHVWGGALDLS